MKKMILRHKLVFFRIWKKTVGHKVPFFFFGESNVFFPPCCFLDYPKQSGKKTKSEKVFEAPKTW